MALPSPIALALDPVAAGGSGAIAEIADDTSPIPGRGILAGLDRRRSDQRLMRAAQDGSEEALEVLFRRHWPTANRAAYLVVRDAAAAEDIAQEAFLSAVRSLDRFDRRRPFGPWLHRIVVNRAIDWSRARRLRGEVGVDPEGGAATASGGDEQAGDAGSLRVLSDDVGEAIAALDPERRAIVVLRYLLEFTPGEIAETLGLPRGTVNSRLRRALDQLGEQLEEERP